MSTDIDKHAHVRKRPSTHLPTQPIHLITRTHAHINMHTNTHNYTHPHPSTQTHPHLYFSAALDKHLKRSAHAHTHTNTHPPTHTHTHTHTITPLFLCSSRHASKTICREALPKKKQVNKVIGVTYAHGMIPFEKTKKNKLLSAQNYIRIPAPTHIHTCTRAHIQTCWVGRVKNQQNLKPQSLNSIP